MILAKYARLPCAGTRVCFLRMRVIQFHHRSMSVKWWHYDGPLVNVEIEAQTD